MALSMEVPREFSDALERCNYADQDYSSDLTDTENDEEFASTPKAFEQIVPRCLKRTYGVLFESVIVPERRLRSRIHEQLELLREVIPNSCADEKASILTDAYEYIEKLQRQVQELHCELDTDSWLELCPSSDRPVGSNSISGSSSSSYCARLQPMVEVVRNEDGLKIHIECNKRPGLLVDIMELLESSGLNVEQASIACLEHLVFDGIGSEVEVNDDENNRQLSYVSAEDVGANLMLLVADQRIEAQT